MLSQLLGVFGFLSVLCRGLILALASLTVGGVSFSLITLRDTARAKEYLPARSVVNRWTLRAAVALAVVQFCWLAVNSAVLMDTAGVRFSAVYGANFFVSGALMLISAVAIAIAVRLTVRPRLSLLLPAMAIIAAEVMTSHAAARLAARGWLILFTAVHQGATAIWIGGLLFWALAVRTTKDFPVVQRLSKRFSRSAQAGAGLLFLAGIGLSFFYVRSAAALIGTSYGLMLMAKVGLFGLVLLLGWLNHTIVWRSGAKTHLILERLRAFGEAEIGIGFTLILAAASLTSQPPGVDLTNERVDPQTIVQRLAPRVPGLATPPLSSLSPSSMQAWKQKQAQQPTSRPYIPGSQPYVPPTEGDIAWSEYNHHWAGIIVLCAGVLAVLSRSRSATWARHWPLAFCGLAVFLLVRADPENWPLGPNGFWESFSSADVLQHRLFVVLILGFSAFEWGIATGRLRHRTAAMVFPLVCALGGALLMAHSHALANLREELLAELSHLPLAVLAVVAGWTRWLELRLPRSDQAIPSRIWPVCLAMLGMVLLFYREA